MFLGNVFRKLDEKRFLRIPIWHFSYRSFFHLYGQLFLWRVCFAHPLRFLRALRRARDFWAGGPIQGVLDTGTDAAKVDLVAPGFCMKPECPVGRFTHRCLVAEKGEENPIPEVCRTCAYPALLRYAASRKAAFYVMTSSVDIARHLFLPNLRHRHWRNGLFFLCPYSADPFLLAALSAGFEMRLVTFCCGACADYEDFSLADRGDKPERTEVAPELWRLFALDSPRVAAGDFVYRRGVYWPADQG